jgi:hypothetical protein
VRSSVATSTIDAAIRFRSASLLNRFRILPFYWHGGTRGKSEEMAN